MHPSIFSFFSAVDLFAHTQPQTTHPHSTQHAPHTAVGYKHASNGTDAVTRWLPPVLGGYHRRRGFVWNFWKSAARFTVTSHIPGAWQVLVISSTQLRSRGFGHSLCARYAPSR